MARLELSTIHPTDVQAPVGAASVRDEVDKERTVNRARPNMLSGMSVRVKRCMSHDDIYIQDDDDGDRVTDEKYQQALGLVSSELEGIQSGWGEYSLFTSLKVVRGTRNKGEGSDV
jgi:hypothetical protein